MPALWLPGGASFGSSIATQTLFQLKPFFKPIILRQSAAKLQSCQIEETPREISTRAAHTRKGKVGATFNYLRSKQKRRRGAQKRRQVDLVWSSCLRVNSCPTTGSALWPTTALGNIPGYAPIYKKRAPSLSIPTWTRALTSMCSNLRPLFWHQWTPEIIQIITLVPTNNSMKKRSRRDACFAVFEQRCCNTSKLNNSGASLKRCFLRTRP